MRMYSWIFLALILTASAPLSRADSYTDGTFLFTATSGNTLVAPSGSFMWDNSTQQFTSIAINWVVSGFDISFELAGCANGTGEPPTSVLFCYSLSDGPTSYRQLLSCNGSANSSCGWYAHTCAYSGCYDDFFQLSTATWSISEMHLDASPLSGNIGGGSFTVPTPEPSSAALCLLALALSFLLRAVALHAITRPR